MHKTAEVLVRENQTKRTVRITGNDKPEIEPEIIKRWQRIINLVAKILEVPAGLIMQAKEDSISVLLKSQNPENPYSEGGVDSLGHGIYCETVIGENRELLIDNALTHEDWKDNPDVKLNMISYCGLPIQWEDGEFFGTICVLDNKTNYYCDNYRALLEEFKITIESDLRSAQYKQQLRYYAEMDVMTATYNRNKMESVLASEFERSRRYGEVFSLTLMDINSLKKINDTFGHCKGDEIIKTFASAFNSRIRDVDHFGRWGGDEFMLLCPNTVIDGMETLMKDIFKLVTEEMGKVVPNSSFCYGCAEYSKEDHDYQEILKIADQKVYLCKEGYRR